jgi:glycosyltransferase involved in cell wall biosynthesis
MKLILSHPTANANVRATASALLEANLLSDFYTSVASFPGTLLDRLGSLSLFSEIRRRRFNPNLRPFTRVAPWREVGRILSSKVGFTTLNRHESGYFCLDAVYQNIDKKVAANLKNATSRGVKAVYNYEDGSLLSFTQAKNMGLKCFYDLPIGYWRAALKLLKNERERMPDWADTLTNFEDSEEKLIRKDKELSLADVVIVASTFTATTLLEYPGTLPPIEVIPYGFPPICTSRDFTPVSGRSRMKFLFVGGLSQRKGIADLFAVMEELEPYVELTVVGRKASEDCKVLNMALTKHKWIPSLSHAEILKLMQQHDVLIFPSLFEGFGLVISEAMSQGTPVITTERTAGPDLINNNQNGWLIQAGVRDALRASIENLLTNPEIIISAGKEAMETARLRPWKTYGQNIANVIFRYS